MKIAKVREVKTPTRGTSQSAGFDFYVPEDFESTLLKIGDSVLIPTGIKAKVPKGYALIAFNKSGVATKYGLQVGACVVDEDYQGEIHIHLIKATPGFTRIDPGMKLIQFILLPVFIDCVEIVLPEELYESESERGTGGFGSTGVK